MLPRPPRPVARLNPNTRIHMKFLRSLLPLVVLLALPLGLSAAATKKKDAPPPPDKPAPRLSETQALAVLNSDAGLQQKAHACQILADSGGPKSVATLAGLLSHEQLCDYARSGLESIADPAAGAALRAALPKLQGRQLAGVINSLGVRRDGAAVANLRALALDPQRGAGAEAVASLGLIANAEAAKALQQVLTSGPADLRVPAAHAAFVAAEQLAQEKAAGPARDLLNAVVKAKPSELIVTTAKSQLAALR